MLMGFLSIQKGAQTFLSVVFEPPTIKGSQECLPCVQTVLQNLAEQTSNQAKSEYNSFFFQHRVLLRLYLFVDREVELY